MLESFREQFKEIMSNRKWKRDYALADLMTDMEREYKIPMINSETFNKMNYDVMTLYKKISMSRGL